MDERGICENSVALSSSLRQVPGLYVRTSHRRGITLVEILVTVAIIALIVGVSYPTFTRGLDGVRLQTSLGQAGAFFNQVRQTADRRQQPVQLTVDPKKNRLSAMTVDGSWRDYLAFDRVRVVFPTQPVNLILYPAHPAPQFHLLLASETGKRAGLRVNVFTGVPEEWDGKSLKREPGAGSRLSP